MYRLDEATLEVLSQSKYIFRVHEVITILNNEAAGLLPQSIWFDKFNTVDDVDVKIYNKAGFEIQHYKKKDFTVQNYYDGFSLATDDKIMRLPLTPTDYPCTIETSYVNTVSSYIDLPDWIMNNSSGSVEHFRFVVKVAPELDIRYRVVNTDLQPVIETTGKMKVYTWEAKNVAVKKIETGTYEGGKYLPRIEVSPQAFEYDGYKGTFNSWNDFGKWNYALYEEKKTFSEERVAEIKALIKDLPNDDSKIKVLYDYLKKNMRYVSIQLGIGGFKPFATSYVDEKKFGDCKALTNYMRSLLAIAGIKSYPALINAGYNRYPAPVDFPENVFNHVILCIPRAKDLTWLECTSNNSDPGYLGSFTENKNALLLTETGGYLVATPKSNYNDNVMVTVNNIFLDAEGGAAVKCNVNSTGSYFEMLDQCRKMNPDQQKELFVNALHYKEPEEFTLNGVESATNLHQLHLTFQYVHLYDFKAGEKYFFPKSVSTICNDRVTVTKDRKNEYVFNFPYRKCDTTVYHLPGRFYRRKLAA